VKFSRVGEATVPVSGRYTITTARQLSNNRKIIEECTFTRTEIVLNPSFEGTDAFVIDLPNGAFVSNLDDRESGVAYVWHNGKMVPASDYEAPEATWTWGQSQGRLIAALVISGALLGAGAWLWLKRRKRPEANTPSRPSR
jgi:hypothetical protein